MSEFGSIYSIDEAVSHPLSSVSSKGDWYEVMGEFELEAIPKLDACVFRPNLITDSGSK